MKLPVFVFTSGLLLASLTCSSKILLPSVIGDHMVLERNSSVAIWGWGDANDTLRITGSWAPNDTVLGRVMNDGHWRVDLPTKDAGGPYTLTIKGKWETVTVSDVMLGEVWICSGQSNMEFSANWGLYNRATEVAAADFPGIRFFHVPKIGAAFPQQDCRASWAACTPQTMQDQTAVGYYFARMLQKTLNVPLGIIQAAWGGTPAEVWVRADRVRSNPVLVAHQYEDHSKHWPDREGTLYNGMIAPFIPYGVAGALWYQGESNTYRPGAYAVLMDSLVNGWRQDFGRNFPFYFVQIAPFTYDSTKQKAFVLREQQDLAQRLIPGSGMISIGDIAGDIHDIHPKDKKDVGERLARYALAETYHQNVGPYLNPTYKSMKVEGHKVILSFDHAEGGLVSTDKDIPGFQVAGADGQYVDATGQIYKDGILLSNKSVPNPVSVRYCFTNSAVPTVKGKDSQLPLAPFRTDSENLDN
ncbi:sialate O-acetylesterase [Dinghuibacter silviterrae]|nr:sialate O-acetylesterase [Dinghuibacter silviterrae]